VGEKGRKWDVRLNKKSEKWDVKELAKNERNPDQGDDISPVSFNLGVSRS